MAENKRQKLILHYEEIGIDDVGLVGGKNASLGEMIQHLTPRGVRVPSGFVVTAEAYRYYLKATKLDIFIQKTLAGLDTRNLRDLAARGKLVRETILKTPFPAKLKRAILDAARVVAKRYGRKVSFAVRSSATAEDLPGASFAGEHETYLHIQGGEAIVRAVRAAMASLFTNRAISYRADKGFDHMKVALSVGVQKMVRSDMGASGVMFTVDTESGFKDVVIVNGSWGLGEMIVQGEVTPDEFLVYKPHLKNFSLTPIIRKRLGVKNRKMIYAEGSGLIRTKIVKTSEKEASSFVLSEREILLLTRWGAMIEEHYSKKNKKWMPMDIEWAKDGETGELSIVQARPETVQASKDFSIVKEYVRHGEGKLLVSGASVGSAIAVGKAHVILDTKKVGEFRKGEVLITTMTDPDWEPIMKIAAAIVTDKGGRTSHAAIVSRELGIPCIVGTENATKAIRTGRMITVDTTGSEGIVFDGAIRFKVREHDLKTFPKTRTKIMMNVASPEIAFEHSFLPNDGVGLAREEFIIASQIGIHPNALLEYAKQTPKVKKQINMRTRGWRDRVQFYIDNLAYGIGTIGAAFYPKPVIVRFSDFKTNEYRGLLGGEKYEPREENPMIGFRGASRYYHPLFAAAFALECRAIRKVREEMGLTNVIVMVPFCRTPKEGEEVMAEMKKAGLARGRHGLKAYVMAEIPSNVILADKFLDIFDGMSIGSNDLTQLTVGLDRDSEIVNKVANENDPSVVKSIETIIARCRARRKYVGICGQAPSDYPSFAAFLVARGIESISLNPDTILMTRLAIAKREARAKK